MHLLRPYRSRLYPLRSTALALAFTLLRAQDPGPEIQARIAPVFERARAAEREGDFRRAAVLYDDILKISPNVAEVWTNKGLVLLQLARNTEALAAFERARSLNEHLVVPHLFIGIEYNRLGRTQEAVAALEKAVELAPGNPKALFELARAYMNMEANDRAVWVLSRIDEKALNADDARFTLGLAYLRWSRALSQKLVAGKSPYGRIVNAEAEAVAGFPEPAADRYKSAIAELSAPERAELPVDPQTLRVLPRAIQANAAQTQWTGLESGEQDLNTAAARAWHAGRYNRALQAAQLRLRQGDDPRAMYWLSLACRALARETLLRAVQLNPESARTHLIVAEMAKDEGDNERAVAELAKAASADPRNAEVRLLYIQFLVTVRDTDVLAQARAAAAAFPNDARINCELGRALIKGGFAEEAVPVFRRAAAAEPALAAAHAGLADAHAALGRLNDAIQEMRGVLSQDKDGSFHYRLGRWYQQTGRVEEARTAFAETARIKAAKLASLEGRLGGPPP